MAGDLSFRIELDSADAEKALNTLQESTNGLHASFQRMAEAVSGSGGLTKFVTIAAAGTAAVLGLTAALFSMAKSASETVDELGEMAAQMGTTIEEMSTLKSALVAFEASGATAQRAMERLGNTVQEEFPKMQKAAEDFALKTKKDLLSVESATLDVADAQDKLSLLQRRLRRPGEPLPNFANLRQEAIDRQDRELKRAQLAVDEALAKQEEARAKADENAKNSVDNLVKYVNALADGMSTAGTKVNVTVDNMIKGLIGAVGPGVQALDGVGSSFGEIAQKAPELSPVLLKLADLFKNMEDSALKMAIATKLFGRKDARSMVESLSEGSKAIKAEQERLRSLGLEITKVDDAISKQFIKSMNQLGNVIGIVSTQFGLLFQPGFTVVLDTIREALENNREAILKWGESIRDTVMPIVQTFVRVLTGGPKAGTDDWLLRWIENIKLVGRAVTTVITGVIIPAFQGLVIFFTGVAVEINTIFGTAFTGLEVLVMAVVARMALAFGAMLVGTGPVGWAILGIGLAVGLLIKYWPQLSAAAIIAWDAIKTKAAEAKAFIDKWVTTPVENAWKWIKETWDGIGTWISTKIAETRALIAAWVTTPVENAWKWLVDSFDAAVEQIKAKSAILLDILKAIAAPGVGIPALIDALGGKAAGGQVGGGYAGGGLLGGRGTGTSDSNLAWVSRGEHIMPARAVSQPGVLAFLEALRRSGGNLRDVLDGMGRFALGGMVSAPLAIPAFAGGGMNNNVTIQFPGLPEITGLRASSGVVDELRKAAALAQVRSGGRKPSRY